MVHHLTARRPVSWADCVHVYVPPGAWPLLLAGEGPSNPYVVVFACQGCHATFYGEPLLRFPTCPACEHGQLEEVRRFDLRSEPLWPFLDRRPA